MSAAQTLIDLPYEILCEVASWVDTHDLVYSLSAVCTTLNAVANDPVTWAKTVVTACCLAEEEHLIRKHASITTIRSQRCPIDTAVKYCPNICVFDCYSGGSVPLESFVEAHSPTNLQHVQVEKLDSDLDEALCQRLRYLSVGVSVLTPLSPVTLSRCSGLTALRASGLLVDPSLLSAVPNLRFLATTTEGLTTAGWNELGEALPHLTRLDVWVNSDVAGVDGSGGPAALYSLHAGGAASEQYDAGYFVGSVVAANTRLRKLVCYLPLDESIVRALAQCSRLESLAFHTFSSEVDDEFLSEMAANLSLTHLECGWNDRHKVLVDALGYPVRFPDFMQKPDAFLRLGPRLRDLRSLSLFHTRVTQEVAETIGNYCKSLVEVEFGTVTADDVFEPMFPALAHVSTCKLNVPTTSAAVLATGLAASDRLTSIEVRSREAVHANGFVEAFFAAWDGGTIDNLTVDKGDARTVELVLAAHTATGVKFRSLNLDLECKYEVAVELKAQLPSSLGVCGMHDISISGKSSSWGYY